jgi:chromosome segregation ATPase
MKSKIVLMMSIVGLFFSCDKKKEDHAKLVADSLRTELQSNKKLTEAMVEIGTLLDSIDASRRVLRVRMIEGTDYQTFASRMHDINQYVRSAEAKIESLEKSMASTKGNNAAYAAAVKKMKNDLEARSQEVEALKEQIAQYKNENSNLINTVDVQKAEIDDKLAQIKLKQEDIAKLQGQVNDLMVKSTIEQGDAYFAQAAAFEEMAKRTHFAPKKKKNSRKEALELYKLALNFGKDEAKSRIAALEKKM